MFVHRPILIRRFVGLMVLALCGCGQEVATLGTADDDTDAVAAEDTAPGSDTAAQDSGGTDAVDSQDTIAAPDADAADSGAATAGVDADGTALDGSADATAADAGTDGGDAAAVDDAAPDAGNADSAEDAAADVAADVPDGATGTVCLPDCTTKICGSDGCGGSCGTCNATGDICGTNGQCSKCGDCLTGGVCGATPDTPDWCSGGACSPDTDLPACTPDGSKMTQCVGGLLQSYDCVASSGGAMHCATSAWGYSQCFSLPNCTGKVCGDDGSGTGGTCGTCGVGLNCDATGQCVDASMVCGKCENGAVCQDYGLCVLPTCGTVTEASACTDGGTVLVTCSDQGLTTTDCAFSSQGVNSCRLDDGYGAMACLTPKQCSGKVCGTDGDGAVCGWCGADEACVAGACVSALGKPGDTCAEAIPLGDAPTSVTATTAGMTDSYSTAFGCTALDDLWGLARQTRPSRSPPVRREPTDSP